MVSAETNSKLLASQIEKNRFLGRTYGWMGFALLISAICAFLTATYKPITLLPSTYRSFSIIALVFIELILVIWFSSSLHKMSYKTAVTAFITYSIIDGITLSTVFMLYSISSIALCFLSCAIMFFIMALYGTKTKTNLSPYVKYFIMMLVGVLIVSGINLLFGFITGKASSFVDWIISLISIVLFTGLTAYDSQKISKAAVNAKNNNDFKKLALYGALELYLDFINLFLSLLRFFGKRK